MKSSRRATRGVEEGLTLQTKFGSIDYDLKRSSRRRTIAVSINESAAISVASPMKVPPERIIQFLNDKAEWIITKAREMRAVRLKKEKKYSSGEEFLFLGQKYPLQIQESGIARSKIEFKDNRFEVTLPGGLDEKEQARLIKNRLERWYKEQAKEILGGRLFQYAKVVGVEPLTVDIRTQKRVWGNCDFRHKRIHLNWQIILAPFAVIDYVIVHELCHLIEPNHSSRFWKKVRQFMPDYEKHKQWLKEYHWDVVLL